MDTKFFIRIRVTVEMVVPRTATPIEVDVLTSTVMAHHLGQKTEHILNGMATAVESGPVRIERVL